MIIVWVLPAYAGMIRGRRAGRSFSWGAPRVCGDDPGSTVNVYGKDRCSPRMRG